MVGNSVFRVRTCVCALGLLALAMSGGRMRAQLAAGSVPITVDYPLQNSVFPPEFPAPLFMWRDYLAGHLVDDRRRRPARRIRGRTYAGRRDRHALPLLHQ